MKVTSLKLAKESKINAIQLLVDKYIIYAISQCISRRAVATSSLTSLITARFCRKASSIRTST